MALAVVQHKSAVQGLAVPGTITLTSTPTAGNLLLLFLHCNIAAASITVNTAKWTKDADAITATSVQVGMTLWRYVQAGDTTTVPAPWTAGSSYTAYEIFEVSGVSGTWATDHEDTQNAWSPSGTNVTSLSVSHTTVNPNCLCLAGGGQYNGSSNPTWNVGWTSDETSNNNANYGSQAGAERAVASATAITATITYTSSNAPDDLFMVTLKPPATTYTLTSAQGTITLTGKAALLNSVRTFTAAKGTYALTGQSVGRGQKVVFIKSGTTWSVPSDFGGTNTIEALGSGGNGASGTINTNAGGSGGSGGYSSASNVALTPGSTIAVQVGVGGSGNATGNATFLKNNSGTVLVQANSSSNASGSSSGAGGLTTGAVGSTTKAGANGKNGNVGTTKGAPSGASAPGSTGASVLGMNAGNTQGGAGGPGAQGGGAGSVGTATVGGAGGNDGVSGTGAGSGATSGANAGSGTGGAGGGGGCVTDGHANAGNGSMELVWTQTSNGETAGPGGGGGGAGSGTATAGNGGNAGTYGAGGGGGGCNASTAGTGGSGANGILVVTYTPVANLSLTSAQGTVTLTGESVLLPRHYQAPMAQGTYVLTGEASILRHGYYLVAPGGTYHIAGQSINRVRSIKFKAKHGKYNVKKQKVILRTAQRSHTIWPVEYGSYEVTGESVVFGQVFIHVSFSALNNLNYLDWITLGGTDYSSYLDTAYVVPQDAMTWTQVPYVYVFIDDDTTGADLSLMMTVARNWAETGDTSQLGAPIQVYKHRQGYLLSVSKNRVRGRGRVVQLQFNSESGKNFNLRGWAMWLQKNSSV